MYIFYNFFLLYMCVCVCVCPRLGVYTNQEDLLTYLKVWFVNSESNTPIDSTKNSTVNSRCHSPVLEKYDDNDNIDNDAINNNTHNITLDDFPFLASNLLSFSHTKKRMRDEQKTDLRQKIHREQQQVTQPCSLGGSKIYYALPHFQETTKIDAF